MQTYKEAEQMTLFDVDGCAGKMFRAHSQAIPAKTSGASLKKSPKSSKKMPISLDLRKVDGHTPDASWSEGVLLPGRYMTLSIGRSHSEGREYAYSQTSMDFSQEKYCLLLNTGEYPREPMPSLLSEILQDSEEVDSKYRLSSKACQGILNRANRRGKKLPEILQKALEAQAEV